MEDLTTAATPPIFMLVHYFENTKIFFETCELTLITLDEVLSLSLVPRRSLLAHTTWREMS